MEYISPRPLQKGSRIAIIAPSSSFNQSQIYEGMRVLSENELQPIMGDNVFFLRTHGLYSAPLENRIKEFVWAIEDESIDGIICAVGGFGAGQLLPHLPYDKIAQARKPIMGFSDISAINNAVLAKSNLISFNGPTASVRTDDNEHKEEDSKALDDALKLLSLDDFWGNQPFIRNKSLPRCVSPGSARGPAIGGNLSTFCSLIGTPYMPNVDGAILFIEDVNESGYEMSLMFLNLHLAGIFKRVAGVVIGRFASQPQETAPEVPSIEEVVVEFLSNGPPCIYGLNFSHLALSAIIPIGTETYLDADKLKVMFDNPFKNA